MTELFEYHEIIIIINDKAQMRNRQLYSYNIKISFKKN